MVLVGDRCIYTCLGYWEGYYGVSMSICVGLTGVAGTYYGRVKSEILNWGGIFLGGNRLSGASAGYLQTGLTQSSLWRGGCCSATRNITRVRTNVPTAGLLGDVVMWRKGSESKPDSSISGPKANMLSRHPPPPSQVYIRGDELTLFLILAS